MADCYINRKLTEKQAAFCQEYQKDLNGSQAALRAGYSKKSAGVIATQLLKKTIIKTELARVKARRIKRCEIKADEILEQIKSIADRCAVDTETEFGTRIIDAQAALRAYELLGKHLAMWTDKTLVHQMNSFDDQVMSILKKSE